jgi:hypothetical protein
MLEDAPSLLEHLDSNLENNQLAKRSLTVRPKVTAYYRDRFVRVPILPHPPSSRSFIVTYLVFSLSFFPGCLYLLRLAPADDAARMVPFPSKSQRDGSYIRRGYRISLRGGQFLFDFAHPPTRKFVLNEKNL